MGFSKLAFATLSLLCFCASSYIYANNCENHKNNLFSDITTWAEIKTPRGTDFFIKIRYGILDEKDNRSRFADLLYGSHSIIQQRPDANFIIHNFYYKLFSILAFRQDRNKDLVLIFLSMKKLTPVQIYTMVTNDFMHMPDPNFTTLKETFRKFNIELDLE
jgi:hypothetical protein